MAVGEGECGVMFVGVLGEVPCCLEMSYVSLYNASGRTERITYFLNR
jgi:hypothetical protein